MPLTINSQDIDIIVPAVITHNLGNSAATVTEFSTDLNVEYLQQYNNRTIYLETKQFGHETNSATNTSEVHVKCVTDLKFMNSTTDTLFVTRVNVGTGGSSDDTVTGQVEKDLGVVELAKVPGGDIKFTFKDLFNENLTVTNSGTKIPLFNKVSFYFNLYIMK